MDPGNHVVILTAERHLNTRWAYSRQRKRIALAHPATARPAASPDGQRAGPGHTMRYRVLEVR